MVIQDPIEKTICAALAEQGKLGYNELKDAVFAQHVHCSNLTFSRKLKKLLAAEIVARQDAPRGYKVHYSLMNRFSLEKEATLSLKEYVDILEKSFQQVKENFDNLEVIEKANSLSIIFGMAIVTRFQLDLLNIAEPNSKGFKEQQWRVFRIANEIFNFAKEKASPDNSEMQLVYAILANEVIKMADLLENSLKTKKKPKKRQANS